MSRFKEHATDDSMFFRIIKRQPGFEDVVDFSMCSRK